MKTAFVRPPVARHALTRVSAEPIVCSLGVVALTCAYVWLAQFGLDFVDEGYFADLGTRVMRGELPYRDFDTYYTPALFYVQAAVFSVFGVSVITARLLMIAIRVACCVVLYRLTGRVAPWPIALLPPLLVFGADLSAGSHPAWPALLGTLLMLEVLATHHARLHLDPTGTRAHAVGLLALAGAAAGLAFAFKQNVGAFAMLGGVGYIVLRPRPQHGWLVVLVRCAYVLTVLVAVFRLLEPSLTDMVEGTLWLPLVSTLVLSLLWSAGTGQRADILSGFRSLVVEGFGFGAGLVVVTLAWLVPLVLALGQAGTPFGLLLGDVKRGAVDWPLQALPRATPAVALAGIWLPLAMAALLQRPGRWLVWPLVLAATASLLVPSLPLRPTPEERLNTTGDPLERFTWVDIEFGTLLLYLPALAAWSGLLMLLWKPFKWRRVDEVVLWYLLVGVLAQLALYPRVDPTHALFAGPPLLVVGAAALSRAHRHLAGRLPAAGQAAVLGALLIVPIAAAAPQGYTRVVSMTQLDPVIQGVTYAPLLLPRAPVLMPEHTAADLRALITFVQDGTQPGEPFFAYPVAPMANVLADRPNPTRFDHFLPGALSDQDMHHVVASLEQARPRFVLWDHLAVVFWETDKPNRILSDYIWRRYRQVATFRFYLILERAC